jgi:hypothetical protein
MMSLQMLQLLTFLQNCTVSRTTSWAGRGTACTGAGLVSQQIILAATAGKLKDPDQIFPFQCIA